MTGAEPYDAAFSRVARAMRAEEWWLKESPHMGLSDVSGEIDTDAAGFGWDPAYRLSRRR